MKKRSQQRIEEILAQVPGWIFLITGAAVIVSCMVMPAWTDYQHISWQKKTLQEQVYSLSHQEHTYNQINEALTSNDPLLLKQLALSELSMLPPNTQPLPPVGSTTYFQHAGGWFSSLASDSLYESVLEQSAITASLPPSPVQSSLYRLTTGPQRSAVMCLGLLGLVGGLIATPRKKATPKR